MSLTGEMLIGGQDVLGDAGVFRARDAATGAWLDPPFGEADEALVAHACLLAQKAFRAFRATGTERRAGFLDAIAERIEALGDTLIVRAMQETGLPRVRLESERGRTVSQLRLFASEVRDGGYLGARIDSADAGRQPASRPDLRLTRMAIGPVAVFGASNFPLAFSVAGGDTASALAAGCPVVVKAHPVHPGTSRLVAMAVAEAVRACAMPAGTFALLFGEGNAVGAALVADPHIKAVGFTGSRAGGLALMQIAARRPEPVPVYAEMSSINPVLLFPHALAERAEAVAAGFAASLTMGAGQFCTNPGLVLAIDSPALDMFVAATAKAIEQIAAQPMLSAGIHEAYAHGITALRETAGVELVACGPAGEGTSAQVAFFATTASAFLSDRKLHAELFGPASLLVRCGDPAEMSRVLEAIEGQLTIALHMAPEDEPEVAALLPLVEEKAGRLLADGFGTGVEVTHAMVHGGPFPATSDGRSTSVGSLAIDRFLRPISYQDIPQSLLPSTLREGNPSGIWRRVNGDMRKD